MTLYSTAMRLSHNGAFVNLRNGRTTSLAVGSSGLATDDEGQLPVGIAVG
jgi:hypothetical protein